MLPQPLLKTTTPGCNAGVVGIPTDLFFPSPASIGGGWLEPLALGTSDSGAASAPSPFAASLAAVTLSTAMSTSSVVPSAPNFFATLGAIEI
jgi:hypothetical protein